ncbi:MAG: hypothetical protein ACLQUT_05385 [Thermoleophilia bacterium]
MSYSSLATRGSIVGSRPVSVPMALPTYGSGRVCAHVGCGTILSRYNSSKLCAAHETARNLEVVDNRSHCAKTPADYVLPIAKRCTVCGEVFAVRDEPGVHFRLVRDDKTGSKYPIGACRKCDRQRRQYDATKRRRTRLKAAAR